MTEAFKTENDCRFTSDESEHRAAKDYSDLEDLCRRLQLPSSTTSAAKRLMSVLYSLGVVEPTDKYNWNVCVIYINVVASRLPYGLADPQRSVLDSFSISVTDLLQKSGVRIGDFFQSMKVLKDRYTMGDVVLQHLLQVERKFLIACPLFRKLETMFEEIFEKGVSVVDGDALGCSDDGYQKRKKFCWILFVYTKSMSREQRGGRSELVFSFHLLLCCIAYVICLTPSFQLKSPFDAVRIALHVPDVGAGILRELCERYQANFDEAKLVQATYVSSIIESLPQRSGIIDVEQVVAGYRSSYCTAGDIDELDFLSHEDYLVIPSLAERQSGHEAVSSGQMQPPPLTPVRTAMNSVQRLAHLLQQLHDGPAPALVAYLEKCEVDPMPAVKERLTKLEEIFIAQFMLATGDQLNSIASVRYSFASRLYYRTLLSMLKQEEERLGEQDFSQLLHKSVFHKCLLACCIEVVLVTYECQINSSIQSPVGQKRDSSNVLFPWILRVFDLKAIDFFKVLDSFVRAESHLAPEIIKHLRLIEAQILEHIAWQNDSPLFASLTNYSSQQQTSATDTPPRSCVAPNTSVPHENTVTSREDSATVNSAAPLPALLSPSTSQKQSPSLNLFINKVFRHAFQRLQLLCEMLHISNDLQLKVQMCIEHCVTQRCSLLRDRHLDQIIMCSIYSVCKVVDQEIKFKTIVSVYRQLPNTSQQVYKSVLITNGEFDSIIAFYNRIFMQSLKTFIMQFASSRSPTMKKTASPVHLSSPKVTTWLPGRKNFSISPMEKSPFKLPMSPSHMTPRTRQLYSFGESASSEKLKVINEQLRAATASSGSRTSKCLRFDQADAPVINSKEQIASDEVVKRKTPLSRKSLKFDTTSNQLNTDNDGGSSY